MNSESQILKQVRVLDPVSNTDRIADVWIAEGKIQAIETQLSDPPSGTAIFDTQGAILAPGLVDLYSHSGEPGYEDRETLLSLISAGAAGGFTRLVILPDTDPCLDNSATLSLVNQKSQKIRAEKSQLNLSSPQLSFWSALTHNAKSDRMTELAELSEVAIGFADGHPMKNLGLLRQLLEYLKPFHKPIALMATNLSLKGNGVIRDGVASIRYGLAGDPALSEAVAIAAILEIVNATQTPVHLMRVSTRRGVELIAEAKSRGVPVTASTTWMHLLFSNDAVECYDPNLRLEPPLGDRHDRDALIAGVKSGIIDAIAIDHTPYTYEEKTLAFAEAPPGVIGLELALSVLWSRFVASGEWTALQLWQALSTKPQLCLQQKPSSCLLGEKAELVLFDPHKTWTVDKDHLQSLSCNTPWWGKQLTGRAIGIWNS